MDLQPFDPVSRLLAKPATGKALKLDSPGCSLAGMELLRPARSWILRPIELGSAFLRNRLRAGS